MRVAHPDGKKNISLGGMETTVDGVIDIPDHHAIELIKHHGFKEAKQPIEAGGKPAKDAAKDGESGRRS